MHGKSMCLYAPLRLPGLATWTPSHGGTNFVSHAFSLLGEDGPVVSLHNVGANGRSLLHQHDLEKPQVGGLGIVSKQTIVASVNQ